MTFILVRRANGSFNGRLFYVRMDNRSTNKFDEITGRLALR